MLYHPHSVRDRRRPSRRPVVLPHLILFHPYKPYTPFRPVDNEDEAGGRLDRRNRPTGGYYSRHFNKGPVVRHPVSFCAKDAKHLLNVLQTALL